MKRYMQASGYLLFKTRLVHRGMWQVRLIVHSTFDIISDGIKSMKESFEPRLLAVYALAFGNVVLPAAPAAARAPKRLN